MSFGKSVKEFWHALLLIVPITLGWIWFLIRNVNLPKQKKAELFWHMNAKNMDSFAENEGLKKLEARRNEKLEKYLPGSDRILDYGCGTGTLALRFSGKVKEIDGIDFYSRHDRGCAEKSSGERGW
jgi:SAM-dependent methyltransferase